MAGAMAAWVVETWPRRSPPRQGSGIGIRQSGAAEATLPNRWLAALADLATPLAAACAALAVLPDFDLLLHTHRTYSHSLGATAVVWAMAALAAWRLRLPVVKTATVCAAAYGSHVLLDWLGRDDSRLAGPMALWPLTSVHFKSGLDLFLEFTLLYRRQHLDWVTVLARNAHALGRELLVLGPPFLLVMKFRLTANRPPIPDPRPLRTERA